MQYAESPETRKIMFAGSEDRLKINVPVLDKILDLRRQCAELLGYETWAHYVLEDRMIKTPEKAAEFLEDLKVKLTPVGQKDRKNLLELKKAECDRLNLNFDNELYAWDWRYYDRLYTSKTVNMDNELIKAHFPVDVVVPAILDIYKELLNVRIEEVPDAVVWHNGSSPRHLLLIGFISNSGQR
jgi:Zn-dependent oligopeptidase